MTGPRRDLPSARHAGAVTESLTDEQRRIRRQYQELLAGRHPLSLVLEAPLPLHPDAAGADDPRAPGARCGTCRFRVRVGSGARTAECGFGDGTRRTGDGSDVRAWWGACSDYQPQGARP